MNVLFTRVLTVSLSLAAFGATAAGQATRPADVPPSPGPTTPRPGAGGGPPPPYTPLRWNEDYASLKDPARRTDFLDPLKYIPLGDDPEYYLSLGGSARYRYELFNNTNFGAGPQDDTGFHLTRLLAHADLHLGPMLRGFVQVKSSMEDGRAGGPRPIDSDEFDVQQAFVDLKLPLPFGAGKAAATLRGGRQDLLFGAHRLVGPLDWANTRRTFEGGRATLAFPGTHTLDLFWVRPVVVENEEPNSGDGNTSFAGFYDTLAVPAVLGKEAAVKLDLYGFALNRTDAAPYFGTPAADEDRYTVGARLFGNPKPFDFDVEGTYQFGKFGAGDISAWSLASEVGCTLADQALSPRLFLGYDIASGDDDPADPDQGTFNQLFPTQHLHFGYLDVIGRQNIVDLHPGAEVTILKDAKHAKKVTLRAEHHLFWRQNDADAAYSAPGGILRPPTSDEAYVGAETDLLLNWQIDRHWSAYVGYSHFFAGDFIAETGASGDIDFFYAALQFVF